MQCFCLSGCRHVSTRSDQGKAAALPYQYWEQRAGALFDFWRQLVKDPFSESSAMRSVRFVDFPCLSIHEGQQRLLTKSHGNDENKGNRNPGVGFLEAIS
jgi:hypothetical protein